MRAPAFLGKGPSFPLRFTGRAADMASGEDLIDMSIEQILGTDQGERVMRPDFGCRLQRMLFENVDEVLEAMAAITVREALERWEPRITVLGVEAMADGSQLRLNLHYIIKATNDTRNRVYIVDRRVR